MEKEPHTNGIDSMPNPTEELLSKFRKVFWNDARCKSFLSDYKWQEGFVCTKCGNTNYCKGKTDYSRRCTRCKKEESVTANTMFHRCKIPLQKAFEMAYLVCNSPAISSYEINRLIGIRHMTCYDFQKKVQLCQQQTERSDLLSLIHERVNAS